MKRKLVTPAAATCEQSESAAPGPLAGAIVQPGSTLHQFLITGLCPDNPPRLDKARILKALPLLVWIDLAKTAAAGYECGKGRWVVPGDIAHDARERAGIGCGARLDSVVCEHMGHLIE